VAIARSTVGDWLSAAEPKWLSRFVVGQRLVAHGFMSVVISIVISFVTLLAMGTFAAVASNNAATVASIVMVMVILLIVFVLFIGGGVLAAAIGVFLITKQEPRDLVREPMLSARRVARVGVACTLVLGVVTWIVMEVVSLPPGWGMALSLANVLALTVSTTAMMSHLAGLGRRVPDLELVTRTLAWVQVWRWLLPAASLGIVVQSWFPGLLRGRPSLICLPLLPLGCAGVVLPFVLLWQTIRLLDLLGSYQIAFNRVAAEARHEQH
jgi:hypothetical protein